MLPVPACAVLPPAHAERMPRSEMRKGTKMKTCHASHGESLRATIRDRLEAVDVCGRWSLSCFNGKGGLSHPLQRLERQIKREAGPPGGRGWRRESWRMRRQTGRGAGGVTSPATAPARQRAPTPRRCCPTTTFTKRTSTRWERAKQSVNTVSAGAADYSPGRSVPSPPQLSHASRSQLSS